MKKKSLDDLHDLLNTYICRDDIYGLSKTLNQSNSLNVNNSKFFNIAIESKNVAMVEILLNYFERNQLNKHVNGSLNFLHLKKKMQDILEVAVEDVEISEEMEKAISFYHINLADNSDESDQDLSGFEISSLDTSDEDNFQNGDFTSYVTEAKLALINDFDSTNGPYNVPIIGYNSE